MKTMRKTLIAVLAVLLLLGSVTQVSAVHYSDLPPDIFDQPCPGGSACPGHGFTDMPAADHWSHNAIDWALIRGITTGTSATTVSPSRNCTRAQIITFVWHAYGSPNASVSSLPFTDVRSTDYFYQAVLWAYGKGIVAGTGADTFSPHNACTRGQTMTILWNAAGRPEPSSTATSFQDIHPSNYYYKPVLWATQKGITAGVSATSFGPNQTCTRAQVLTFLYLLKR